LVLLSQSAESAPAADLPGAVVLAGRLHAIRGDATVAAAFFAVGQMLHPEIGDALALMSAAQLRRAGTSVHWTLSAVPEPSLQPTRVLLSLDRMPASDGAGLLWGALNDGHTSLCDVALAHAVRLGWTHSDVALLIAEVRASCADQPSGLAALGIASALAALGHPMAWPAEHRLRAARSVYEQVRHDRVLELLQPIAAAPDAVADDDLACEALWRTAMTYRRSRRASQSEPWYEAMNERCAGNAKGHPQALYGPVWNQVLDGRGDDAVAVFRELGETWPESRYVDDALFFRVQVEVDRNDLDAALATIEPILAGEVDGDMIGDAVWRYLDAAHTANVDIAGTLERAVDVLRTDRSYRSSGRVAWLSATLDGATDDDAPEAMPDRESVA